MSGYGQLGYGKGGYGGIDPGSSILSILGGEAQDRLEEPRGPGIFWQQQTELFPLLVEAMNEAMLITGDPEVKLGTAFTIPPNQTWLPMPAGILVILRVEGPNGLPIKKDSLLNLDRFMPGWENDPASDVPDAWFPLGLTQWGIHPQLTEPLQVVISGIGFPVNAARPYTGFEPIPFPNEYREGFVEYAGHAASFKEGGAEFEQSLGKYRQFRDKMLELSKYGWRKDSMRFTLGPAGGTAAVTDVKRR